VSDLHVVHAGPPDGTPIVWLGSLGSSTAMWDPQIAAFAGRHRCILIDHPGHGASPPSIVPVTIESLGDGVLSALDDVGAKRAHVVGLSLGAMIAMELAARHPERIDRLALLCTSAHFDSPDPWNERAATVRSGGMTEVAYAVVARWLTPDYTAANPDEVAAFVTMLHAVDPESYARCCEAIAAMDQREQLPSIQVPTLVIVGSHDPATPPSHGETIADLIPGARLETVESAHLANWEQADAVNRLLDQHLEGTADD